MGTALAAVGSVVFYYYLFNMQLLLENFGKASSFDYIILS